MQIERLWDAGSRDESVKSSCGGRWKITDLIEAAKDLPVVELPLDFIDFSAHGFTNDNLYEFAQHLMHVNESSLDFPIIMDHQGRILDGRHRMVKALIEGQTTIKVKRFEKYVKPTIPEDSN